jgi:hypothetical protein
MEILMRWFQQIFNKVKRQKSGSAASHIMQYICFHQVSFLTPLVEEMADTMGSLDKESLEVVEESQEASTMNEQRAKHKRKLTMSAEDVLIEKLLKHVDKNFSYSQIVKDNTEHDDNKLFLVSLIGDFKKISDEYKLNAKSEIIGIVTKYKLLSLHRQQPYMHPEQNYTGYDTASSSPGYHETPPRSRHIENSQGFSNVHCYNISPPATENDTSVGSLASAINSTSWDTIFSNIFDDTL